MRIKSKTFEGKNFEQAIIAAEDFYNLSEEEMIVKVIDEGKSGILGVGSKPCVIDVTPYTYVAIFAEEFIKELVEKIGVTLKGIDSSYSNNVVRVEIDTDNNGVLIGKNGRTLNSINHLVTTAIMRNLESFMKVSIDIANYKDARVKQLERIAHTVSRQVAKTRVDAKLDPMNSYERRIIHEYLSNDNYVKTTSEGDEPNRYVVIKYDK